MKLDVSASPLHPHTALSKSELSVRLPLALKPFGTPDPENSAMRMRFSAYFRKHMYLCRDGRLEIGEERGERRKKKEERREERGERSTRHRLEPVANVTM